MMFLDEVRAFLDRRKNIRDVDRKVPTKHPGSKKPADKKKRRATEKRARASRRKNR